MSSLRARLELLELPNRLSPAQLAGAGLVVGLVPILPPAAEIIGLLDASRPRQAALFPAPVPFPVARPLPVVVRLVEIRLVEIPVALPILIDAPAPPLFYSLDCSLPGPPARTSPADQAGEDLAGEDLAGGWKPFHSLLS